MQQYTVTFQPGGTAVTVPKGTTLLQAQIQAGLPTDAPCGGQGTCGKCRVTLADGSQVLACQTKVEKDMTVLLGQAQKVAILTNTLGVETQPDGTDKYVLAFDIGTTTLVAYLLDGVTGAQLATASAMNPQSQYGADVISRIQQVLDKGGEEMQRCIVQALRKLTREVAKKAGIAPEEITVCAVVGNTAMHHLLLGIHPASLVTPPYMPTVYEAMELDANQWLPASGKIRMLPNIAGFVGGDTVGCMVSTRFDQQQDLTRLQGCRLGLGVLAHHVVGEEHLLAQQLAQALRHGGQAQLGIGAVLGLAQVGAGDDRRPVLLETGDIDESGRLEGKTYHLCPNVDLTQKDVREVQLAKAAIRTGIELLAKTFGASIDQIQKVYLAGAFGNYLTPASACRIGMIPPVLVDRIVPIGNAAGEGSKLCALSRKEYAYSQKLAKETEFLELASLPQFQDQFVDALEFSEDEES